MYRVNEEERKRKIEEQIGKTYGYYTILSFAEFRKYEMFFNCRCVCGTEKVVRLSYLKNGHTTSCGCMRGKHLPKAEKDDLTGMKFGLWNVLHRDTEATTVAPRYICQCECGTIKSVDKYALKNGTSWHCGCQKVFQVEPSYFAGELSIEQAVRKKEDSLSRGRTVKQTIIGGYIFGVGSTLISFIVFGNYSLGLQTHGIVDFVAQYMADGDLYAMIINIIQTLPWATIVLVWVLVTMIAFYATSFDSIAYTASC